VLAGRAVMAGRTARTTDSSGGRSVMGRVDCRGPRMRTPLAVIV
jgi:hypothetical protein